MAAFAALFDPLFCPEEHLDLYHEEPDQAAVEQWPDQHGQQQQQQPAAAALDDELPALFEALRAKEGVVLAGDAEEDGYGGTAGRDAAVGWASRAVARLGFSALTAALAAAYLDRCFLPGGALLLGGDRPWMARLAAVACVALAAKVEETRVPLLLELQLCAADDGSDECVFQSATVRRMELLVLSALGWRMHPVTPFSYLQPVLAGAPTRLRNCEGVLLAAMADWRWPRHRPSAWAAAALLTTAAGGGDDDNDAELLALIGAPEDETAECAKIISEVTGMSFLASCDVGGGSGGVSAGSKRKRAAARMYSPPPSPSCVIGALSCFSCESSLSVSAAAAGVLGPSAPVSVSSSPEPHGRATKRGAAAGVPVLHTLPPDEESRDAWPSTCAA